MDQLMELIQKRQSIRAYTDKPLPRETLNQILEAAKHAPTARNLQQLEYRVITNRQLITRLSGVITAQLAQGAGPSLPTRPTYFYNAPLLIIITGPKDNAWIDADGGLAAQNILLCATLLNLGSCFIGMARFLERDKAVMQELRIAEQHKIVAAVVCGFAAEKPAPKEKKIKVEYFE